MPRFAPLLTLVSISALAFLCSVALHEHLGHTTACIALGSTPVEMGALYVKCNNENLSSTAIRLMALAGPATSLIIGVLAFMLLPIVAKGKPLFFYFLWLFATASLFEAFGYMMLSGVTGLGDLGSTKDGAIYGFANEWAWRAGLFAIGILLYRETIKYAGKIIGPRLPAVVEEGDIEPGRRFLISYITCAVLYIGIGLLNPVGIFITLISGVGPSLGGQFGLLGVSRFLDENAKGSDTLTIVRFQSSLSWIAVSLFLIFLYAIFFGPTLYFS